MVFAWADSRVCPSVTLGLEPGEAFTRETRERVERRGRRSGAARRRRQPQFVHQEKNGLNLNKLFFHLFLTGAAWLVSISNFVEDWVRIGFLARKKVKAECSEMPFEDQCGVLEKEAVNVSLQNLSTYPFVKEAVANGALKLVGGHYEFVSGQFDTNWEL
ncbi:carbonic anhydrase, chloroplastic [Triticum aestivum]|uniref:carbonic anhydrase, chloroplastic n=1 Tax=Triticum aestivum TaxID=4565 RepID=UPI001D0353A1|nr:carbonic anhydrase, chloroplastic-like [Triticum aestivum]